MKTLNGAEGFANLTFNTRALAVIGEAFPSVAKSIEAFQKAGVAGATTFGQLSAGASALFSSITPLLPVLGGLAVGLGAIALVDYYAVDYEKAQDSAQTASQAYADTQSSLKSLRSEYEANKESVKELQALKDSGNISLSQQVELDNLNAQNLALETQIKAKERLLELTQKEANDTAETALKTTDSSVASSYDSEGNKYEEGSKKYDANGGHYATDAQALTEAIYKVDEYEKAIDELREKQSDDSITKKQYDKYQDQIDKYQDGIDDLESDMSKRASNIASNLENITDKTSDLYRENRDALDLYNEADLSPKEKDLRNLESFFDSRDFLKDALMNAGDLDATMKSLGISLESMGVSDKDNLVQYLQDAKKAAEDAANAINKVDGSVAGVKAAQESANQDADWNSMSEALKNAADLYKAKKIGTDDFKTVVEFMTPGDINPDTDGITYDADAYEKAWKNAKDKVKRYFDQDNPLQSAINFENDLVNTNFADGLQKTGKLASKVGDDTTWNFTTSAEAAKSLGLSIEATEVLLKNLESYGAEFDNVLFSGEALSEYETALSGIKSLRDEMTDGENKDRLENLIPGWEEEFAGYQADLSTLDDENIIVEIEFEYNLAKLQKDAEDALEKAEMTKSNEDNANAVLAQNEVRESLEKKNKHDESKDAGYKSSYDRIDSLKGQLTGDAESDNAIFNQIKAIQKLQSAYQLFMRDNGEIDWNEYIKSDEAAKVFDNLEDEFSLDDDWLEKTVTVDADTSEANEKINGIWNEEHKTWIMNVGASTEDVEKAIDNLEVGEKVFFTAELDGEPAGIEAIKNIDGSVTYIAKRDDGSFVKVERIKGTANYTMGEHPTTVDPLYGDAYYTGHFPTSAPTLKGVIQYTAKVINKIAGTSFNKPGWLEAGGFNGTAHAQGTANLNGNWGAKRSGKTLVGELGTEVLVRGSEYRTIGDDGAEFVDIRKGDIIFNHKQTEELFKHGYVTSGGGRAKIIGESLAHGTAYANGMPSLSSGGNSSSSKSSSSSSNNSSDSSENNEPEKLDWIERKIKSIQRVIENLGKTVKATYKSWTERNTALSDQLSKVHSEISIQQQAYNRYMQEANSLGLSSTYVNKIKDGTIDIESIGDEGLVDKINKYQDLYDKALECQDAITDLKDEIAELTRQKFDNVVQQYEDQLSAIDHQIEMIESSIDYVEERGYIVGESYFKKLIATETSNIAMLNKEYGVLQAALKQAMSDGSIQEFSEEWYDMQSEIHDVESAILDANTALVEYKNNLRETQWELFDRVQETVSGVQGESNFLMGLLDSEKMFDEDNAQITAAGLATQGLHLVNYNAYLKQAEDYAKELEKINQDIAEDPGNTKLLDRRQELLEAQRESIESAKDEQEAIRDLAEEYSDTLINAMHKVIDRRLDLMDQMKDLRDFEKDIEDQTSTIASLQKQLGAYKGDNSESAKATIQQLKVQLEDATDNLDETMYERYRNDQQQLYDMLMDETEQWANERLDNIELLMKEAIVETNTNADNIKDTLVNEANKLGVDLSSTMLGIWSPGGQFDTVVSGYNDGLENQLTTTNTLLNSIKKAVNSLAGISEKEDIIPTSESPKTESSTTTSTTTTTPTETKQEPTPSLGSWFVYKKDSYPKSKLRINQSIVDRLKYFDFDSSFSRRASYYSALGGTGTYRDTSSQNKWLISQMKAHGFTRGGEIGRLIRGTGEDGFVLARAGETIITPEAVSQLSKAFDLATPIINSLEHFDRAGLSSSTTIEIGDIVMNGVNDVETFGDQLVHHLKTNQRVIRLVQEDSLGVSLGKNSLLRHKY